ncbi:MAG: 2-C-methyl-D-erythritol 4-phosphate cytidylyltransferase [Candidatus Accumulibacter sp.]|jgi:2-C-methyl-D-erythritol 4-phosphate cytidylyltransferase|nr:2-C-methyl-D-erythritol 4-phosphate cytidylyltransferase [Accumulibacter sp.]
MPRHYAIVPAAGSGARFGSEIPKQYLPLAGRPMIYHALSALCRCAIIERVWVILSPRDAWWETYDWLSLGTKLEVLRCGGATRAGSVANGLAAVERVVAPDDWMLVHDAARPGLSPALLDKLCAALRDDPVGGLLAVPVADTLKRADSGQRVAATESRADLWQAQTPQMFRYGLLRRALDGLPAVTDEAGALEAMGCRPLLVQADASNFKVTYPVDLKLAEQVLKLGTAIDRSSP